VTSSVREDTEAVRYSDLKGWWKLDGHLLDSSGNNRHGTPPIIQTSSLWLDAAGLSTAGATWPDQSSNGVTVTKNGSPSVVENAHNGLSVMRYSGNGSDYHSFPQLTDIRTVFWVILRSGTDTGHRFLLGDTSNYHFHANGTKMWGAYGPQAPVYNGTTRLNGAVVDGQATDQPTSLSIISLKTTGNVTADKFSKDRNANDRNWKGDLGELIIFNTALEDSQIAEVEGYLAQKWGLTSDLPATHPYKSPSYFKSDSANGTGQSLDLSNGVSAVVPTGGTEDVFDGGSAFSTSLWVKGWPAPGSKILNKDSFNPKKYGELHAWFEGTEPGSFSTTSDVGGPTPSFGDQVTIWHDKSGNGYHAVKAGGTATYSNSALKGDTVGVLTTGSTSFVLDDSATTFDQWSKMTIVMLYEWDGASGTTWHSAMHKGGTDWSSTSWVLQTMNNNSPHTQGTGFVQGNTAGNGNYRLDGSNKTYASANNPKIIVARYDGSAGSNHMKLYANGDFATQRSSHATMRANPGSSVVIGGASHDYGDIMIFRDALSDSARNTIEGYIAHKYGIESLLVDGHTYKASNTDPISKGWSVKSNTSQDEIVLNLYGAGGEYPNPVPVNDGNWHHLATTYDGSNKKVYIDGVEVATSAQTGSVAASNFPFIIGDLFSSVPDQPKIDDIRVYGAALTAAEVAAIYNEGENDVGAQKFSVTSPATMQGAVGKSVSYQITTDAAYGMTGYNSNITYTLLNKPSWLSVNGSTGAVSGTPPSAGTYTFQAKATNTLGTGIKDVTIAVSDYANWNYAIPFTTDYNESAPLKDWNMLVRLSEDTSNGAGNAGFRYSQASSNGGDLRFVSKAGEE